MTPSLSVTAKSNAKSLPKNAIKLCFDKSFGPPFSKGDQGSGVKPHGLVLKKKKTSEWLFPKFFCGIIKIREFNYSEYTVLDKP